MANNVMKHNTLFLARATNTVPLSLQISNLMTGMNGRVYGHLAGLDVCVGDKVLWHLIGFGSERDVHTFRVNGHSFLFDEHRYGKCVMSDRIPDNKEYGLLVQSSSTVTSTGTATLVLIFPHFIILVNNTGT